MNKITSKIKSQAWKHGTDSQTRGAGVGDNGGKKGKELKE